MTSTFTGENKINVEYDDNRVLEGQINWKEILKPLKHSQINSKIAINLSPFTCSIPSLSFN